MELWDSALKIIFLDTDCLGKIETSQIQGIPGFLDVHIPGFKDQEILRKRIELSNYDELIPNMSNLVKNRLHQETFRSSI